MDFDIGMLADQIANFFKRLIDVFAKVKALFEFATDEEAE